jgi:Domain of unknown function (DUF4124)
MKILMPISVGWFLFLACSSAFAQGVIYKWIDAKGKIHFSNTPTHEAEAVDDTLPPASTFDTQAEPTPPATASTQPVPQAPSPSSSADEAPPAASEPAVGEPTAVDAPGLPPEGPLAAPVPSASADQPVPTAPGDAEESDSETE